jgi:hypothetical protein
MTRVSDRLYRTIHGRAPRGYGMWMFEKRGQVDETVSRTGTYTEARKALPSGEWIVLP